MKKNLLSLVLIATLLNTSCINMAERINGNGNIKSENRKISKADKIKVTGDFDVYVQQGPVAIKVEADDNILPYIKTELNDSWLEVKTTNDVNINSSQPVKVYITTPSINDLKVTGSGNITCNQKFSSNDNMSFNITGSGDITTDINSPKVVAHIAGSGNLHITGETKDLDIHITGSGNYEGSGLKAENAQVSIAGSGDAILFADASLKASIAGSGNIKYKGNPIVNPHVVGSGTVAKAE